MGSTSTRGRAGQAGMGAGTAKTGLVETNLHFRKLTLNEATAYLVGTNVGAAILSLPFAARTAGYPGIVIAATVATIFAAVSHLYIAEAMLRTPEVTQLVGLFRAYLFRGRAARFYLWFLFLITIGVAIPSLTAYILGGSAAISALLGVSQRGATLLFFLPAAAVVWLGLRATGYVEKLASLLMGGVLVLLTVLSFLQPSFTYERLGAFSPAGIGAILPVAIFTCMSQAVVPELVRGLAHQPELIPKAIKRGLAINFAFVLFMPLSIFGLLEPMEFSEIATVSWGKALGPQAFVGANLFAFLALITSFWGTAGTILTNVVDFLRFPSEWRFGYRLVAFLVTVLPSMVIVAGGWIGFLGLIQIAGSVGGVLLALLPIPMLRRARSLGRREPEFTVGLPSHGLFQSAMVIFYVGVLVYAAVQL